MCLYKSHHLWHNLKTRKKRRQTNNVNVMATSETPTHVVIFPFMSQGHILPLLDIAIAFSHRNITVNIITTPLNAAYIFPHISSYPLIRLAEIPFPTIPELPERCENVAQLPSIDILVPFMHATKRLQQNFNDILKQMVERKCRPVCVISDFFLGWTLETCRQFGIPRLVFHGMGAFSMVISKSIWKHKLHRGSGSNNDTIHLPGTQLKFELTKFDLPESFRFLEDDSPFQKFVAESGETDVESWGVILNSFDELENEHTTFLNNFYQNRAKVWSIGPAFLYNNQVNIHPPSSLYLDWLNDFVSDPATVLYVSFGSQAHLSDEDVDEIRLGLEMSGCRFLWVLKSSTWSLPDGFEERVKGRGLIVREWVDQRCILAHPAIGGFLSHCGWNSVLESLSMGVPILALPMNAEQPLNAKLIVEELEAGIRVKRGGPTGWAKLLVQRDAVRDGVEELMGEKGRKVREKVRVLGKAAKKAVEKGGSSYRNMTELINALHEQGKKPEISEDFNQTRYNKR